MISVICWLWQTPGYRSQFLPEHVNSLRRQVARHYPEPHRFLCVTDLREGFDPEVELVADRRDFAGIPSPHGGSNPSCYRRLRLFEPGAAADFGERFVSLDLDTVIVGDLRPLWQRPDDFVIWRDPGSAAGYCASMLLLRAGSRPAVWWQFDPELSPAEARAAGCRGSDQAWITYCLGAAAATWSRGDGVLSFRLDLKSGRAPLPPGARIVFFHGRPDPWAPEVRAVPWIQVVMDSDPRRLAARS